MQGGRCEFEPSSAKNASRCILNFLRFGGSTRLTASDRYVSKMFSRGLLAAAMAVAMCSPAAAAGYGASPITMRHLNLEPGQWSGPVIQEEILTGHRLFLRNAGDALQVPPSSFLLCRAGPNRLGCREPCSSPLSRCSKITEKRS